MTNTIIVLSIVLIIGILSLIYNERLSKHFAIAFLNLIRWVLPSQLQREQYFFIAYRIIFYAISAFCFAIVIFMSTLIVSNFH